MNPETVAQLLEDRVKIDQEMRTRTDKVPFNEWVATDTESASLVKKIIAEHGPVLLRSLEKRLRMTHGYLSNMLIMIFLFKKNI